MNGKIDIYEHEEIEAVFDFIKTEKNITHISEVSGVSTITSDSLVLLYDRVSIYLQAGQIITINNVNYNVLSVNRTLKQFTITATGLIATKWNLAVNYKFGSRIEVNELLTIESKDTTEKLKRFPLAWLIINEPEQSENLEFDHNSNIKLVIAHLTKPEYRADYRLDNVLKTVIQPLITLFLSTIQSPYFSDVFQFEYGKLRQTKYNRFFYGSSDKNEMVLSAPTDAIEIEVDLTFQNQYN